MYVRFEGRGDQPQSISPKVCSLHKILIFAIQKYTQDGWGGLNYPHFGRTYFIDDPKVLFLSQILIHF